MQLLSLSLSFFYFFFQALFILPFPSFSIGYCVCMVWSFASHGVPGFLAFYNTTTPGVSLNDCWTNCLVRSWLGASNQRCSVTSRHLDISISGHDSLRQEGEQEPIFLRPERASTFSWLVLLVAKFSLCEPREAFLFIKINKK
jgi:hypothetical protein